MRPYAILVFLISLLVFPPAGAMAGDISLTLRQRDEKSVVMLDILVTNISTSPVQITSEGIVPPWSVQAWFAWEVDGEPVEYFENIAGIPGAKSEWIIPRDGTVLWASIPILSIKERSPHLEDDGKIVLRSLFEDGSSRSVRILPTGRWGDIEVTPGTLDVEIDP